MMAGGAVGVNVSLESASPRMQKVMRKNLNIPKFRDNLEYICKKLSRSSYDIKYNAWIPNGN